MSAKTIPLVALMLLAPAFASADAPDVPCSEEALAGSGFDFCAVNDGVDFVQVKGVLSAGVASTPVTFPVGSWSGDRDVAINVRWDNSPCPTLLSPPCGFTVLICNDRDMDGACTNIASANDELRTTAASQGALGACKDQAKGCDDPNEAGWTGCLNPGTSGSWSNGQLVVFVGVEVGPSLNPVDVQAALSSGSYSVWVDDLGTGSC